jgi:hypothetical protein
MDGFFFFRLLLNASMSYLTEVQLSSSI